MARQEIILGTAPTGLGGDPPRTASTKINAMTTELYGTTPVARGGTGATTTGDARTNLGLASGATATVAVGTQDQSVGRLLKVGDYGIGGGAPTAVDNIDNMYAVLKGKSYAISTTAGTKPTGIGMLDVISGGNGDAIYQEWYEVTGSSNTLRRFYRGGFGSANVWGAWFEYYHTGNTTRAADGTLKAV